MRAVDTNVLLYAHDPRDPRKQTIAVNLIGSLDDGALLWQVACEYLSASKKLEPHGYSGAEAWQDILDLRRVWTTILPDWTVQDEAHRLMGMHSLSHWDSLIIAAAIRGGVTRLYSENFSGYSKIEALEIVNPF